MSLNKSNRRSVSHSKTKVSDSSARETLLRAAKHLFARKGLSGTSIRDIAGEAKLNSSLISYYFNGKEGLYQECIRNIGEGRLKATQELLQPPENKQDFRVRLKMFLENMFSLFFEDRDAGLIIIREYDRAHSPAEKVFQESFLKVFDLIVLFFKAAQKREIADPKKDPFILASLLFSCLSNEMRLDHLKERTYGRTLKEAGERKKLQEHIIELFLAH